MSSIHPFPFRPDSRPVTLKLSHVVSRNSDQSDSLFSELTFSGVPDPKICNIKSHLVSSVLKTGSNGMTHLSCSVFRPVD